MTVPFHKRLISYIFPVRMRTAAGKTTPALSLYLYRNHWQLAAETALYSDGPAYRPLKKAFLLLKKELGQANEMLVLGAGLGSAAYILDRMQLSTPLTFVDIDGTSISWAKELMPARILSRTQWHCTDVRDFVVQHQQQYDVVVVDIFIDRIVPSFVIATTFLQSCARLLRNTKGKLVLNYIINSPKQWQADQQQLRDLFDVISIIDLGLNQVVIAQTKQ